MASIFARSLAITSFNTTTSSLEAKAVVVTRILKILQMSSVGKDFVFMISLTFVKKI